MDPFTPVPLRPRHDGWTPERQRAFIAALGETGSVAAVCRVVGKIRRAAYQLRRRPGANGLAAAWDAALAGPDLDRPFAGRALGGVARPITWRGRQVGERGRVDNRLAKFILSLRRRARWSGVRTGWDDMLDDLADALDIAEAPLPPVPYRDDWILPGAERWRVIQSTRSTPPAQAGAQLR